MEENLRGSADCPVTSSGGGIAEVLYGIFVEIQSEANRTAGQA